MRSLRRLHIPDPLALIASTCVSLLLASRCAGDFATLAPVSRSRGQEWETVVSCVVAGWMVTSFLLRLRQPRPPLRSLAVQPGFAAAFAVVVALLINAVALRSIGDYTPLPFAYSMMATLTPGRISLSVASAWLALVLSGGWRCEASWLDRLGRVLGAVYVLYDIAYG